MSDITFAGPNGAMAGRIVNGSEFASKVSDNNKQNYVCVATEPSPLPDGESTKLTGGRRRRGSKKSKKSKKSKTSKKRRTSRRK